MTPEELRELILAKLSGPQFVQSDAGTMREFSINELLAAERHLAEEECTPGAGQRPFRMYGMRSVSTGYDVRGPLSR